MSQKFTIEQQKRFLPSMFLDVEESNRRLRIVKKSLRKEDQPTAEKKED